MKRKVENNFFLSSAQEEFHNCQQPAFFSTFFFHHRCLNPTWAHMVAAANERQAGKASANNKSQSSGQRRQRKRRVWVEWHAMHRWICRIAEIKRRRKRRRGGKMKKFLFFFRNCENDKCRARALPGNNEPILTQSIAQTRCKLWIELAMEFIQMNFLNAVTILVRWDRENAEVQG